MKKKTLQSNIFSCFLIFTFIILGGLWLFEIVFLDVYYEYAKSNEIELLSNRIESLYGNKTLKEELDKLSYEKNVCIEINYHNNIKYSSINDACSYLNNSKIKKIKLDFINSNDNKITYKLINPKFNNKTLMYGIKLDNSISIFISTSLEPIGSTISVLKRLMMYISVVVLFMAFIIAYTISKKISKPIVEITDTTKTLKDKNYNVKFKTNSDIEEIVELEDTLNSMTSELSKTEELRREMLANVSHDLKTPLTLIKANAEMVKDLNYNKKEKRNKNLNTIIEEVDRLNLLVEDILELSKIQSNSVELNLEIFDLDDLIKNILEKFQVLCDIDGYKIIYTGFKVMIQADKKKMSQVIYNLINNAINYTGESKEVLINLIKNNDNIRLEIIDRGNGIKKEDLKYIWDKYYKVDKKYKRVTYGSGLGLSIVKNILELHNFKYGVKTIINKGTTFYIEISFK